MTYISLVHQVTQKIPKGKVTTYGAIAEMLNVQWPMINMNPRMVGYALHQNKSKDVPCHRVVNREGRLAPNFAFNGAKEQKRRLEAEGVNFLDEMHVEPNCIIWRDLER